MTTATIKSFYDPKPGMDTDGTQFDHLFDDDERFPIGQVLARPTATRLQIPLNAL